MSMNCFLWCQGYIDSDRKYAAGRIVHSSTNSLVELYRVISS